MTSRENSKLNMYQTTIDVCNLNSEIFKPVRAFVDALSELNLVVNDIRQTEQNQSKTNVQSATLEKNEYEVKLLSISLQIANAIYVYAFENNDRVLLSLNSVNKSSFLSSEGNKKLSLAGNIYRSGTMVIDKLDYYGITPETLDDLQKAISNYEEHIVKPRDIIVARKNYTENLKSLFAKADSVLYDKLDKLIVLFKDTGFYNEYKSARNIVNTSVRHKKEEKEK
jgi:hypothetical protein